MNNNLKKDFRLIDHKTTINEHKTLLYYFNNKNKKDREQFVKSLLVLKKLYGVSDQDYLLHVKLFLDMIPVKFYQKGFFNNFFLKLKLLFGLTTIDKVLQKMSMDDIFKDNIFVKGLVAREEYNEFKKKAMNKWETLGKEEIEKFEKNYYKLLQKEHKEIIRNLISRFAKEKKHDAESIMNQLYEYGLLSQIDLTLYNQAKSEQKLCETLLNDKNVSKNKTLELNSQLEEVKRIQENIERKLKI